MARCVLINPGRVKNYLAFPKGVCVGCGGQAQREEKRNLGYASSYLEGVPVPLCAKCATTDSERKTQSGRVETTTRPGLLVDLALAAGAFLAARYFLLPWPVGAAAALTALVSSALLIEPIFHRLQLVRRVSDWSTKHPEWPLSLPVVNLWRGDVLPSGEVVLLNINEPATAAEWAVMVCVNDQYAATLAETYARETAPVAAPPPVHQSYILLPTFFHSVPVRHVLTGLIFYCLLLAIWWRPFGHWQWWWKALSSAAAFALARVCVRTMMRFAERLRY